MELFHIYTAIAAFGYAIAATLSKLALARGAGILRISFLMNWVFVLVFVCLLWGHEGLVPWAKIQYPLITGLFFFLGQVFTFTAIRFGDVSLQTPIMGTKVVFAVLIALVLGTEVVTFSLVLAAVVAMLGIGLLGFSGDGVERVGRTLLLALLSAFFFAGSDTMVGYYANDFGVPMFLFLAILMNAALSCLLIPFFRESIAQIPASAWSLIIAACLTMAGQALLLNYTLGRYQHVAEINVIYSTRGLWTVLFGALSLGFIVSGGRPLLSKRIFYLRLSGALLMCVAIAILFYPSEA